MALIRGRRKREMDTPLEMCVDDAGKIWDFDMFHCVGARGNGGRRWVAALECR